MSGNWPLRVGLIVLPTLFFFFNHVIPAYGKTAFDALIVSTTPFLGLLVLAGKRLRPWTVAGLFLVSLLAAILVFRYAVMFHETKNHQYFQAFAFFMEVKPIVYLLFVSLLISIAREPGLGEWVYCCRYFAILVIADFLVRAALYGLPIRPSLLDEANYDNVLVLLGVVAYYALYGFKVSGTLVIFTLATLCSQSKTGLVCFAAISTLVTVGTKDFKKILLVVLFMGLSFFILISRLERSSVGNVNDVDRVQMLYSFLNTMQTATVTEWIIGRFPGIPISFSDPYIGWFIKHQTEEVWGGTGLHPFNYHGMWFRLFITWGVLPTVLFIAYLIKTLGRRRMPRCLLVLIVLQGIPMGVFYLSTVGAFVLYFAMSLANHERGLKHVETAVV